MGKTHDQEAAHFDEPGKSVDQFLFEWGEEDQQGSGQGSAEKRDQVDGSCIWR